MRIVKAEIKDIPELYRMQLLAFESEAEMIGSKDVPALLETENEYRMDFPNWSTLKLENDDGKIIGAIRYKYSNGFVDIGRLMIHPDYRRRGLAQELLFEIERKCPNELKELYTCTKSWSNILLYEKLGTKPIKKFKKIAGYLLYI